MSDTLRSELPTGTVTFLRTDVEGSMEHARRLGSAWDAVNATHQGIIRATVEANGGITVRSEGDALFAAFPEAGAAATAAIDAQRALADHAWSAGGGPRVRIGLHSGEAHLAGDDYGGFEVNRAARIAAAGHGGQIVVSGPTKALIEDCLPAGVTIRDLGDHALRDVPRPERLYQLDVPGLPTEFPPLRTARPAAGNLPTRLTSFVGRESELDALGGLLSTVRLITLTGPGGIGKTSLATELARAHADDHPDGAWFVGFDVIDDPSLVLTVIARTIGLFDGPERAAADGLSTYATDRTMLFVLDNFERLLDAAGDVAAMLRLSPKSRIIVTSRAPLRIPGEQEYAVRPLTGDGPDAAEDEAAVALFVERARAVQPDWDATDHRGTVHEICRSLDGLPLGIELAAARISLLPVGAIRDRLAAGLPLPGTGPRDVPARQRTLEAAIAWSYDLLDPADQRLLESLSVFDGSFDAEQAAMVADADGRPTDSMLDGLMSLSQQSLIVRAPDSRTETMLGSATGIRSILLQTIQTFALARLAERGDERAVRRRHADAYLAIAEQAALQLPGTDQPRWLDRLALDHANLRAALHWSIDAGESEVALRLVAALWRYWQLDGHLHEGRALADAALAMPRTDVPAAVRLAAVAAGGNVAYWQADSVAARRQYEEQLDLAREVGDPAAEADAVFNLGHIKFVEGDDPQQTIAFLDDVRARFEAIGDKRGVARVEWGRGNLLISSGQFDEAAEVFARSVEDFETLGDVQYQVMAFSSLGLLAYLRGDIVTAARYTVQGLMGTYRLRDRGSTTLALQEGVILAAAVGRLETAATLRGAHDAMCERHGIRAPASLQRFLDSQDAAIVLDETMKDSEQLRAAQERGRGLSLDEAVALMVELGDSVAGPQGLNARSAPPRQ